MEIKILLAVVFGILIGLERESSGKPIGIRTTSFVTLASCLFSIISIEISGADPSRVIAQIVSGISFICIGVIVKEGTSIKGLTTSVNLWTASAIGVACGVGLFKLAFYGLIVALIINLIFKYLKWKH